MTIAYWRQHSSDERDGGKASSPWGIIAVINSMLAGVFLGLLISQLFALSLLLCFIPGIEVFLVILVAQLRYQNTQWQDTIGQLKVLFPQTA